MANTMNVSLTPELIEHVNKLVESGQYGSQSEVVRAALRYLLQTKSDQDLKRQRLIQELEPAMQELEAGKGIEFDPDSLIADFEARLRDKAS
jgi:putative addiction module CopG family antidote